MAHDTFSTHWYATFLEPIASEHTAAEAALIERHLPSDAFRTLLDIACGPGRHAAFLADEGYEVVGIDKDETAIASARGRGIAGSAFHVMDMRDLASLGTTFDGAVNLWHSFGYYDEATNEAIVRSVADSLRPGGRAVFDIYNRDHMRTLPALEAHERNGVALETRRTWEGNRMCCRIAYADNPPDVFEWRLFTPPEFGRMAERNGFREILRCAWFDESIDPAPEHARMQFVLERTD